MLPRAVLPAVLVTVGVTLTAAWTGPGAQSVATPVATSSSADMATPGMAAVRFVVAANGNEARYRVTEQLVGLELPNDAVGVTSKVTGGISVDEDGRIIPGESRIVVDVTALKSDKDRRDGYVQRRLLETERYPTVTIKPTSISGLPVPLPGATGSVGPRALQMTGDLTVRGVTRPTTWDITASYNNGTVTGTAKTAFAFTDFQIEKPKVSVVLSVVDTIRLEYDFTLVRQ